MYVVWNKEILPKLSVRTKKILIMFLICLSLFSMLKIDFDMLSPKQRQKIWIHREIKTINRNYPGELFNHSLTPNKHYHYQKETEDRVYDLELDLKHRVVENSKQIAEMEIVNTVNDKTEADSKTEQDTSSEQRFDLIFSAYMRSGSTIMGKLFGNRFDTFYFFEPLWNVAKFKFYKGKDSLCRYYLPECANLTSEIHKNVKTLNDTLDYLQDIFDCSFHKHVGEYLVDKDFKEFENERHDWSYHKGFRWNDYKTCRQGRSEDLEGCLKAAEVSCRSAEHRVVKLLRMTMDNLEILLERNRNLKIVHLFRDPRGIINSHIKTGWFINDRDKKNPDIIKKDAGVMCERMMIDLKAGKTLQDKYPNRIKFIQYEDLERILQDKVPILNEFVGMKYEWKQVALRRRFFEPKRHSEKKGFHPYSYRTTLPWETVRTVDQECAELLKQLGYTEYKSEEHLRNLSHPAAVDPLPFAV